MDFISHHRTDLPVVLIYDQDPTLPQAEIEDHRATIQVLLDALVEIGHPVQAVCIESADLETPLKDIHPDEHLILNWCEELPGVPRSEYMVAQVLEQMGFAFTGAGARTLELGQDKRRTKRLLEKCQIPTPVWQLFTSTRDIRWSLFPAIVKPAFEHCSYGITREAVVQSMPELVHRIQFVLDEMHEPAVVEEFIDSREFHVGVIGNGKLQVLPPGEIDYSGFEDIHDRLCTYESNFDKTSLAYKLTAPKLPVDLPENLLSKMEEIVRAAYRATRCRDYGRMDMRLRDGNFYLLDANSNPDISSDTSLVLGAGLAGFSYGELGSLFINFAAQRHRVFSQFFPEKIR